MIVGAFFIAIADETGVCRQEETKMSASSKKTFGVALTAMLSALAFVLMSRGVRFTF